MAHKEKENDIDKIQQLIKIMKDNNLAEVELKHGDSKIYLKRAEPAPSVTAMPMISHAVPMTHAPAGAAVPAGQGAEALVDEGLIEITSPIVGTFYAQPSPDSDLFVEVGSKVTENTVVCIIEAMKVMNEIKAEVAGTIAEVVASSGQAVEYGQVLFKVKPD